MTKYPNIYRIEDGITYIDCFSARGELTGTIIIDTEDLPKVQSYKWHIDNSRPSLQYAQASLNNSTVRIHKLIMPSLQQIDHINHNGLDNRKSNLREATNAENNRNKKIDNPNRGIRYNSKVGSYYVRIMVNKKEISLGAYKTLEEARQARIDGEIKYFGNYRYNY